MTNKYEEDMKKAKNYGKNEYKKLRKSKPQVKE